jgi:hypothetical protein
MLKLRWAIPAGFVLPLLVSAGCLRQRLDVDLTLQVEPGKIIPRIIDAPRADQNVTLTVDAADAPVNVYLVLAKDSEADADAMLSGMRPAHALAGQDKVQQASLEATVPAGNDFAVLVLTTGKATQVKLKLTGR